MPAAKPPPQGIEIPDQEAEIRFGSSLAAGERDWLEWRINRFLGKATDADAPILAIAMQAGSSALPALADEPPPRPRTTHVRVDEGLHETRFHFPNSRQTGTFSGVGSIAFGLAIVGAYPFYLLPALRTQNDRAAVVMLVIFGLFALLGVASILNGLTTLFGTKILTITREKISYRASLFGLAVWWTLPTDEVLSMGAWKPEDEQINVAERGGRIRTATREITYGTAVPIADRPWVYDAVTRCILHARAPAKATL